MQGDLSLETISELAIALAGFSGLIAMLRSGPVHDWPPRARLSFWLTLNYSVAAVIFSSLPSILRPFGVTGWAVPSVLLGAFFAVALVVGLWSHFELNKRGFPSQNPWHAVVSIAIPSLALICSIGSGTGLFSSASYEWYRFGVLACLLSAIPAFLASFRVRANEPTA